MARPSAFPIHPRTLVLEALKASRTPLSAYELLEKLKAHGIKAPPVVYRALETLVRQGFAHRIQAVGAYIACNCDADHGHAVSVITVCGDCNHVEELHDHGVMHHLEKLRKLGVALRDRAVIELPVTCGTCRA